MTHSGSLARFANKRRGSCLPCLVLTSAWCPIIASIIDGRIDIGAYEGEAIFVTTTVDENNGTPDPTQGNGTSLREAVLAANTDTAFTAIYFDPSTDGQPIQISLAGTGEDFGLFGDFDINTNMIILGNGTAETVINANQLDRVFDVHAPGASIAFLGLTAGSVFTGGGGAVRNTGGGTLNLFDVHISNSAALAGGGVQNFVGTTNINNSQILNNTAFVIGGGVSNEGGTLTVDRTLISNNTAGSEGGGLWNQAGQPTVLTNSGIIGNTGNEFNNGGSILGAFVALNQNTADSPTAGGGGVYHAGGYVEFFNTLFNENDTPSQVGAIYNNALLNLIGTTQLVNSTGGGIFTDSLGVTTLNGTVFETNTPYDTAGPGTVN